MQFVSESFMTAGSSQFRFTLSIMAKRFIWGTLVPAQATFTADPLGASWALDIIRSSALRERELLDNEVRAGHASTGAAGVGGKCRQTDMRRGGNASARSVVGRS